MNFSRVLRKTYSFIPKINAKEQHCNFLTDLPPKMTVNPPHFDRTDDFAKSVLGLTYFVFFPVFAIIFLSIMPKEPF